MTPGQIWLIAQWVGIVSAIAATAGGLVAAFKAIYEWKRSTDQRRDELKQRELEFRHKQAVFARDCIRDIFEDRWSRAALRMLDWEQNEYEGERGMRHNISRQETKEALRVENTQFSEKEVFIRTCFESLYDSLEQLENLIQVGVLNIADILTAFRYYMERAMWPDLEHSAFLEKYDYGLAKAFIERFRAGNAAAIVSPIPGDRRQPFAAPETPKSDSRTTTTPLRAAAIIFALLALGFSFKLAVDFDTPVRPSDISVIASGCLAFLTALLSLWMWKTSRQVRLDQDRPSGSV